MLYCNHGGPPFPDRRRGRPSWLGRNDYCLRVAGCGVGPVTAASAIRLDRLELRHGALPVVSALSGTFQPGSLTALVGPNGAGKTTLLRAIMGLHPPASGRIERGGLVASDFALLPQGTQLDRSFPIICRDVVALAAPGLGSFRALGRRRLAAASDAISRVGLAGLEMRPVQALSAGQFQRLLFARTILQDAAAILMDEPFSAVDAATTRLLLTIIHEWHAQGRTLVVVLHDMDIVRHHFPHTLMLNGEASLWGATAVVADCCPSFERHGPEGQAPVREATGRQAA
jgi:zinc/manganese transport system ATP-binding protein